MVLVLVFSSVIRLFSIVLRLNFVMLIFDIFDLIFERFRILLIMVVRIDVDDFKLLVYWCCLFDSCVLRSSVVNFWILFRGVWILWFIIVRKFVFVWFVCWVWVMYCFILLDIVLMFCVKLFNLLFCCKFILIFLWLRVMWFVVDFIFLIGEIINICVIFFISKLIIMIVNSVINDVSYVIVDREDCSVLVGCNMVIF